MAAEAAAAVLLQTFPRAPEGYRCTELTTHDPRLTLSTAKSNVF